jgi:hypothetical protein
VTDAREPGPASDRSAARPPARGRDPFGDVLPDRTRDEHAPGWGDSAPGDRDAWLRGEVPPHHHGDD